MNQTQFNDKIDITRDSGTTGGAGNYLANWTFHLENVPCKIDWREGQEFNIQDRITSSRDATIFTAILDITVKDRVQFESELYNIVSVIKPQNRFMKIKIKRNTEEEPI